MGDASLTESPLAACDDVAMARLATGLVDALHGLNHPWMLRLRQLPVRSPLATELVAAVSTTSTYAGARRPVLRFTDDRPATQWLSRNTDRSLKKARNRVRREGHRLKVGWVEPWGEIEEMLPELVRIHRARDLELRGATLLDDRQHATFYQQVVHRHAGQWRLLLVRIDGSVAAYALCLKDGDTLRVWDNRVAPDWRRYSAGLIANAEVILRGATDGSVAMVDWGCGEQRYKTSLSSDVIEAQGVTAWSSRALWAALVCARTLRSARAHQPPRRPGLGMPSVPAARARIRLYWP
jgi:CelD/BcsL family acetyltransferase involved in cellulose biosynthesis